MKDNMTDKQLNKLADIITSKLVSNIKSMQSFIADIESKNTIDMLKLLCFNDAIHSLHTHSYSFQTATGRHIINTIKEKYYK